MRTNCSSVLSFSNVHSLSEIAHAEQLLANRRKVNRPNRKSKLQPFMQAIAIYMQRGNSLQRICDLLQNLNKLRVHKSTLMRFIHEHPALLANAMPARH